MHDFNALKWTRITLFSLFVVALLGALMRYKIAFSFPFFNQKNLQHAHSHFAFAGWVSQLLMIYMVALVGNSTTQLKRYERILTGNLALAFGMLIAFSLQGYGLLSIAFSTATVALSFYFIYWYLKDLRHSSFIAQPQWFYIAMACNVVSAHGTLLLSIMMATHSINQHVYLASVYWYLHFQYNGWFFFAIMGLFVHYFHNQTGVVISKKVWILMGSSILPAYGLSILWLSLPAWLYLIIVAATIMHCAGWFLFLLQVRKASWLKKCEPFIQYLLVYLALACTLKMSLQLGSVVPAISKLAFGFRPIVIAYLHLVLLAITSVYLLLHAAMYHFIPSSKSGRIAIIFFVAAVFLNELVLAVQGIASFSYTVVPFANEMLLAVSVLLVAGSAWLLLACYKPAEKKVV